MHLQVSCRAIRSGMGGSCIAGDSVVCVHARPCAGGVRIGHAHPALRLCEPVQDAPMVDWTHPMAASGRVCRCPSRLIVHNPCLLQWGAANCARTGAPLVMARNGRGRLRSSPLRRRPVRMCSARSGPRRLLGVAATAAWASPVCNRCASRCRRPV